MPETRPPDEIAHAVAREDARPRGPARLGGGPGRADAERDEAETGVADLATAARSGERSTAVEHAATEHEAGMTDEDHLVRTVIHKNQIVRDEIRKRPTPADQISAAQIERHHVGGDQTGGDPLAGNEVFAHEIDGRPIDGRNIAGDDIDRHQIHSPRIPKIQIRPDHTPAEHGDLIHLLYDAALDPLRLEPLIDAWDAYLLDGHGHPGVLGQGFAAHVERASAVLALREDAVRRAAPRAVRGPLDDIPRSAAFLSDGGPTVVACNRAAGIAFGLVAGGPLAALPFDPEDIDRLRAAARRIARDRSAPPVTLRIRSAITASPVLLRVAAAEGTAQRPAALVVSTELVWPIAFADLVQEAFGLTVAEVEIVEGISLGLPVRDIAEARGRSTETVRTQLRSILAKTETHSQSELVRVVLGLMDMGGASVPAPAGQAGPMEPCAPRSLRLGDGRRLEWIEFGAADGVPVLHLHGDLGCVRWPAAAERAAKMRGLRVVAPVRAGYGQSDLHPKGADPLTARAHDLAAVLDHLGVRAAAVLALEGDLGVAARLAGLRGGLVSGIVGCTAHLPGDRWHRLLTAPGSGPMAAFLVQAALGQARTVGAEAVLARVFRDVPADAEAFARGDVRDAVLAGVAVTLSASAGVPHVGPVLHGVSQSPATPVLVLEGGTERQATADPAGPTRRFVADTGRLLFFAQWPFVLDELIRFLPKSRNF